MREGRSTKWRRAGLCLLLMGLAAAGAKAQTANLADEAVIAQMQELVRQSRHDQAYALGRANEGLLGHPVFDLYYGIAALHTGVPGEAVFALERHVAQQPSRLGHFMLGKGYFVLGEDLRAKEEFEDLLATGKDPDEAAVIWQYLDNIWWREGRYRPVGRFYAEVGVGRSDNINAGLPAGPVAGIPGLNVLEGATYEREADTQTHAALGVSGRYPFLPGWVAYGGLHARGRWNQTGANQQFDTADASAEAGVELAKGRHLYRLGLDHRQSSIDGQRFLDVASVTGDWHYRPDQFHRWGASLAYSDLNYHSINYQRNKDGSGGTVTTDGSVRDSALTQASVNWSYFFVHPWAPMWVNELIVGRERNDAGRSDLSRNMAGLKSQLAFRPASRWLVVLNAGFMRSSYRAPYGPNLPHRQDSLWNAGLTVQYRLARDWTLQGEWARQWQRSNVDWHDHTRSEVFAKLRYEFK